MNHSPASLPREDAMKEADLVLDGYTVSSRGTCMTRIGPAFVMRDGTHRCVRVPVTTTDAMALGAMWADFNRSTSEMSANGNADTSATNDAAWRGTAAVKDAALVLDGYTATARGVCLARVVGHYVTRDGVRRYIRFLVDTVDPMKLGTAWAAFSGAAGWVCPASEVRVETLNQPLDPWADAGKQRRASA
jgi:hypothetical protein